MGVRARDEAERFWEKVRKDGPVPPHAPDLGACWMWTAVCDPDGYGIFAVKRPPRPRFFNVRAHRYAIETTGVSLTRVDLVCHACDTPGCVRPSHLFVGTPQVNTRDMLQKGRNNTPRGDAHWSRRTPDRISRGERHTSKVTEAQVREIRRRAADGERQSPLAREFGLTPSTVSEIVRREIWKHVE